MPYKQLNLENGPLNKEDKRWMFDRKTKQGLNKNKTGKKEY